MVAIPGLSGTKRKVVGTEREEKKVGKRETFEKSRINKKQRGE